MTRDPHPQDRAEKAPPGRICRTLRRFDGRIDGALGRLSPRRAAAWLLGISLAFAGAMVGASWLVDDAEASQTLTHLLTALWWIPFSLLAYRASRDGRRCSRGGR